MDLKSIGTVLKETANEWQEDKASRLAAALAFYTLLSIAPLLVLAVSIVGLIFGDEAARGELTGKLTSLMGAQAGEGVQTLLTASARAPGQGLLAALVSIVVALFGASGVFAELQDSLDTIWDVTPKPGRGIKGIVRDRFFAFAMVLGVAFLLLASLVISTVLSVVSAGAAKVADAAGAGAGLSLVWPLVNLGVSLAMGTLLFAIIFKVIPDVRIAWKDVWVGALVTAALFTLGKWALGLYLGRASVASPYGAAGSVVVMIIWVYYSSQILFMGAEFTQVWARHHGSQIEPTENAIPIATRWTKPSFG